MTKTFKVLTDMEVPEVSSVDSAANQRKFALFKEKGGGSINMEKGDMPENAEAIQKAAEQAAEEVKKQYEELMKAQGEEAAKQVEALTKAAEDLKTEREALAKQLKEERDEKHAAECVAKAKEAFSAIPAPAEEVGALLKDLHDNSEDLAIRVEELLIKAAGAIAESAALEEAGNAGQADGEAPTAWDAIVEKAKKLQEAEAGLSDAQARTRVMKANPELYKRYREGK